MFDLVSGQIESAIALDQKMSERAMSEVGSARTGANKLRGVILGTLSRCRASLADEVAARPELPRTLDAQLFGYLDELDDKRASQGRYGRDSSVLGPQPSLAALRAGKMCPKEVPTATAFGRRS